MLDGERLEIVLAHHFDHMLAPGLIAFGVAKQVRRFSANLQRDEPKHRRWHRFLRVPCPARISQEAELHRNTQPVRTGAMRRHKLKIGGSKRVKLLILPKADRQRHDLGALGRRQ